MELTLKSEGHLISGIMVSGDVFPDAFQRPGAMTLDVLQLNTRIEGVGGT